MAAPKMMTLPPPASVAAVAPTTKDASKPYRYESLPASALDELEERGRVLLSTPDIKRRLASQAAPRPPAAESDAVEELLWGQSSELVRKVPHGIDISSDEADKAPAAVISNDQEIISQG